MDTLTPNICRQPVATAPTSVTPAPARPRRPLAYIAGAFIAGIAYCYFFAPPDALLLGLLAALMAALAAKALIDTPPLTPSPKPFILLICAVFLAGSAYTHATFQRTDPLEQYMTDGEGYVENAAGHVLLAEQRDIDYRLLTLWADGRKLLVRVYGEKGKPMAPALEDLVGKRVSVRGPISLPDTARNPGGFDYRLHLLSKNIRIILTCEFADDLTILNDPANIKTLHWRALGALAKAKAAFTERVQSILPPETASLFIGMMFGDKGGLDEETYDLFKRHGVAHILSVSGLHVGMVYAFVSMALGKRKTKKFYVVALVLLLCYAALSNFSPSVMRAFSMIAVHIGAMLLNRRYDMLTGVLFSALIVLLINPLALFGVGFVLSYTAVCSLSFALPFADRHTGFVSKLTGRAVKPGELREIYGAKTSAILGGKMLKTLIPAAIIQVLMLPLTMYFFNTLPVLAILINIPVIALASLIVPFGIVVLLLAAASAFLPALAALANPAAGVGASSTGVLIDIMLALTQAADKIPHSSFTVPSPPLPIILLFYFVTFFLLSDTFAMSGGFARLKARGVVLPTVIALSCLLVMQTPMGRQNDAPYTFVDVGQGDCLHIKTADGRNYLMDGGGRFGYDIGKNVLAPYLLKNGVAKLDGIFVSHLHMDHFKGLAELAAYMDVGAVYVYEGNRVRTDAVTHAYGDKDKGAFKAESLRFLAAGDTVLLGGRRAQAETLFPPRGTDEDYVRMTGDGEDENETSLLMRFENEGVTVLMTGDVTKDGERAALELAGDLSCDILKVGHHGSKTSTSEELLASATASIAVIQVGKNNFGHPTAEVLADLEAAGLPIYRNDTDGAVLIHIHKDGFTVQTVKRDLVSPMLLKPHEKL
ncbi:MAG: DNA internalization-related competence protein ComEC/Rec2 [Clostridiales bacterium]|nr:DNA internalization-related competence protein ComEC/Rec2 [Clostridiales bacterium]